MEHPATRANLATLAERGVAVVPPASGPLTSGDTGVGRLAELDDISAAAAALTPAARPLDEVKVLATMGGTREPLDPVRYLGNRSSGRMGAAVVAEALGAGAGDRRRGHQRARPRRGAGGQGRDRPGAVRRRHGRRTRPGRAVLAAAVADFRPKQSAAHKLKKDRGVPDVVLEATPDALAELAATRRHGQVLVGFAAETQDHLAAGRSKLEQAGRPDRRQPRRRCGLGLRRRPASAYLVSADGDEPLPDAAKATVAACLDWVQAR